MEDRAEPAIQIYRDRCVFNRVWYRPQLLSVGESGAGYEKQRKAEQQSEYRSVDSLEAEHDRFGRGAGRTGY
jgi:hypothetical protein